jgi:hypothetical protein
LCEFLYGGNHDLIGSLSCSASTCPGSHGSGPGPVICSAPIKVRWNK